MCLHDAATEVCHAVMHLKEVRAAKLPSGEQTRERFLASSMISKHFTA